MAGKSNPKKKGPTAKRASTPTRKSVAGKPSAHRPALKVKPAKSTVSKAKTKPVSAAKRPAARPSPPPSRQERAHGARRPSGRVAVVAATRKVEVARVKIAPRQPVSATIQKPAPQPPSKQYLGAINAYEAGIKLMYAEDYAKAIHRFNDLIAHYPDESEIQASAKARIQACEKKLQERARVVVRSADDHYNIAVALMNRGGIEEAITHLQQAIKLAPKGDHILYALAAANALLGNHGQAVSYLKQSIHFRPENRFQAAQDDDFRGMADVPEFKELMAPPEK
jgi:Flp pilus assembly protein TadD